MTSSPAPVELGKTKAAPESTSPAQATQTFARIEALKTPDTTTLKSAEGNRFTEPLRVGSALVGSVIKAAYAMYDNARTDIRVANASKEMASLDTTKINVNTSAQTALEKWTEKADSLDPRSLLCKHMNMLGQGMAAVVEADLKKVGTLHSDITRILEREVGDKTVAHFTGREAADPTLLSRDEKKVYLAAYKELQEKLSALNALKQSTDEKAVALHNSSLERFESQSNFSDTIKTLDAGAQRFYREGLRKLHQDHVQALSALAPKDPTAADISKIGAEFAKRITDLQENSRSLSTSLKRASTIEDKVTETLKYLSEGVGDSKAVGVSDRSVVFVGAKAADQIATWVTAQTEEARSELADAKKANNPAAIAEATEKLEAASKVVHKQLDDIATLLSKINGGKSADGNAAQSQEDRVLAKAKEAGVTDDSSFTEPLSDYVGLLRTEMESRIAKMFTPGTDGKYDLAMGRKDLAIIDKYDDMLERAIEKAKVDGLKPEEVQEAIATIHGKLKEELNPAPKAERTRIADIVEDTVAAKEKEMTPKKPSLFSRFTGWLFAN